MTRFPEFLNGRYFYRLLIHCSYKSIFGVSLIVISALLASGCDDWFDSNDKDSTDGFDGEIFASRLDTPWEMALAPDGRMFVTQRPGGIAVIESGQPPKP